MPGDKYYGSFRDMHGDKKESSREVGIHGNKKKILSLTERQKNIFLKPDRGLDCGVISICRR